MSASLNVTQSVNFIVTIATLVAAIPALQAFAASSGGIEAYGLIVTVFFVLMRLKFFMDDHLFFSNMAQTGETKSGMMMVAASWLFFFIAAASLTHVGHAAVWLIAGIGISTLWMLLDMLRGNAKPEQRIWLFTNLLYLGAFGLLYWYGPAGIGMPACGYGYVGGIALAYVALTADAQFSKSLEKFFQ